jgi:hypothetical protein
MKYYVYISDSKVDMLYSQIPKRILDRIAADLNVNLGIFSLSVKEKENQEKTHYEKLKLVINYIENNMEVGTVDEPKAYFTGLLPMRWGEYGVDSGLVYFGGKTAHTVLGLGGSMTHVIGNRKGESDTHGGSIGADIGAVLSKDLNLPNSFDDSQFDRIDDILYTTHFATKRMKGPIQTLEFLAKRLAEGIYSDKSHVVLGTPLYVAMVN